MEITNNNVKTKVIKFTTVKDGAKPLTETIELNMDFDKAIAFIKSSMRIIESEINVERDIDRFHKMTFKDKYGIERDYYILKETQND